jgi:hypothetical protein
MSKLYKIDVNKAFDDFPNKCLKRSLLMFFTQPVLCR